MTAADTGRSTAYSGHNRVSTQALTSTAQGVASEVLGVSPELIRASWRDDQGALALSLALPIGIPSLNRVVFDPQLVDGFGGSVWERVHAAKGEVLARISDITGSALSRVDIRVTGVRIQDGGRVR
ncbi:hypothetical protein D477_013340 [Arthrobacter crystallopoietes BAB-32]|uniref:Uncharacterized protein n=1 Tax=Arthrobacter crystallopoietes BAB-32 TaxID=1246476 RepID=N1V643_9MICC|nr:hypothetical protein [Arthrobacter crystallopoietes]EMY33713.1 hypothetical protein D477_013340 [Arthrobacter crystallopoietes BAB-32]